MAKGNWEALYTTGEHGYTVRVVRRKGSSALFLSWRPKGARDPIYRTVGAIPLQSAKKQADKMAKEAKEAANQPPGEATLAHIFSRYEHEALPFKSDKRIDEDKTRLDRWQAYLGDRSPYSIDTSIMASYCALRRAGKLPGNSRKVSPRTVEMDVDFLHAVFEWASGIMGRKGMPGPEGGRLITLNPIKNFTHKLMTVTTQKQPVATDRQTVSILRFANRVDSQKLLRYMIRLSAGLGLRVTAICELRINDFNLMPREDDGFPFGSYRRRGETDKQGNEDPEVAIFDPATARAVAKLIKLRRKQNAIGMAWLFPAARSAGEPWTKDHAIDALHRAEWLAGQGHRMEGVSGNSPLGHQCGTCDRCGKVIDARGDNRYRLYTTCAGAPYLGWHAWRRKMRTDLAAVPVKIVMEAMGWKSAAAADRYLKPTKKQIMDVITAAKKDGIGRRSATTLRDKHEPKHEPLRAKK